MGLVDRDDGWRMPDWLWERIEPLLPQRPPHPLGCHNPRVPDRDAMDAILLVLRTGMQWNALNATGICSSSSAHRRFQEWARVGVFKAFWRQELLAYDQLRGIDWEWLSCDGLMGKPRWEARRPAPIPLIGPKGGKRSLLCEGRGAPLGLEIAGANVNDFRLFRSTLTSIVIERPDVTRERPQGICLDKGYDYPEVHELVAEYGLTPHIRSRGEEKQMLERDDGFRARRWVVERTHAWLNRFRACSSAGRRTPKTTAPCSTSPAASSPGASP